MSKLFSQQMSVVVATRNNVDEEHSGGNKHGRHRISPQEKRWLHLLISEGCGVSSPVQLIARL
jgi:hypothetical protein